MGQGIDLAKIDAPEHAAAMENMRDQLLIVFLKRLGGSVQIPVAEMDDTAQDMLAMRLMPDRRTFEFTIQKKS